MFSLGKNKTLQPKNPVLKGGFHTECRFLPGAGRNPAGRGRDPAPSNHSSELQQQCLGTSFPQENVGRI